MLTSLSNWLQNHMLPCAYKQIFGLNCPMCGFQRSLIELLKGNVFESIIIFPALLPLIFSFSIYALLRIRKRPKAISVFQILLLFDLTIMILTCAYKNIY